MRTKMKVTHVSICPAEAALKAGHHALTPELLAASGARYSRNNEGIEAIISKIDFDNMDKSVHGIFKMVDYGHQSIADMAPAAMFMDDISIWLAYYMWSFCATAGGQESSTRYLEFTKDSIIEPELAGIRKELVPEWKEMITRSFDLNKKALTFWQESYSKCPEMAGIPAHIRNDTSENGQKVLDRLIRNYAFDRSRYFLPVAGKTNVMMIMSSRGWTQLCNTLLSHYSPEAVQLGTQILEQLAYVTPNMIRHGKATESTRAGLTDQLKDWQTKVRSFECDQTSMPSGYLQEDRPLDVTEDMMVEALQNHENRYAFIGEQLKRVSVRFGWKAVAMAEIRDLNRHRTGTKYCPLVPQGFYAATDQLSESSDYYQSLVEQGYQMTVRAAELLRTGDPSYMYFTHLGTQFPFEHTTTADKFIYEAELRTGTGAHYRYANHLREVLKIWYAHYPKTESLILEGMAEPE